MPGIPPHLAAAGCLESCPIPLAPFSSATGLYVLLLRVRTLWALNITAWKRIRLAAVFGLGILAFAASIVRLGMTHVLTSSPGATWNISSISKWAVICACLPVLPALLDRYREKNFGSSLNRLWSGGSRRSYSSAATESEVRFYCAYPDIISKSKGPISSTSDNQPPAISLERLSPQTEVNLHLTKKNSSPEAEPCRGDGDSGDYRAGRSATSTSSTSQVITPQRKTMMQARFTRGTGKSKSGCENLPTARSESHRNRNEFRSVQYSLSLAWGMDLDSA
ncbi:hypothetical protein AN6465.2 [Aspergillus nidulans FGSC A4]|uniref:Rhodopsin domain-containing protein n=1 Tax=Emericella nidulans (strain FGSC A4 / ATCC 38163 / CBS 112.46 / NRRL 194 / M139) TaxID=227321 RepID=Q5AZ15_EMENI|nr:hypothetical protein [Aspergillus nidulans FGSC A4]EAA58487.1 hypothetical protein AN6465.2 [Aspergillus nidulans FGSC A4]CBF69414.1 TPA: hypothetical protein ANIA_06465 [Aspergillus nidulans FGSC A4]|eukprot:XP_664069.1 hypothetical protein AN6465.2 [Aspergillus nidulans FGSC A4]